jgi:transposase-like protein
VTEELCGHSFSASSISRINQTLDEELKKFATALVNNVVSGTIA